MHAPPLSSLQTRLARVRDALERLDADGLVVPASADFVWLTGARARVTERLVALVVPRSGEPWALVPRLEAESLAREAGWLTLEVWEETEDPLARLERRLGSRRPRLLLGEGWRTGPLLHLVSTAECRAAGAALAPLRAIKDPDELASLERAGTHADRVVEETADFARPGMTEREVARFALQRFEDLGDSEPWAIVASGPHAALPHHASSERRIAEDEVLLLDLGAFTAGYGSDITRTYWMGPMPPEAARVYAVVNEARAAGIEASRAGARCEAVDAAARGRIAAAGLAEHFVHRTGHGVGLEVHEPPYLVAGNAAPLAPGMVHSVEPGVYLSGRFGVRLEDLVVVEERGARRLNHAPFDPRPPRLRG